MAAKKNTRFRVSDTLIILLCLGGAVVSGTAFWREYNRTLLKLNEEPVGIIAFKKRVAQRKFADRAVWDRLKMTSPIYNGDTIRTIEQSEANITFRDQVTNLNLDANTLIQILWDQEDGARIDLSGGNLEVLSTTKSIVISSGGSDIKVEGHGSINKSSEGISLAVLEGQADFGGTTVGQGGILAFDAAGGLNTSPMIAMTSFGSSARVLGRAEESSPILFSWNTSNFNPDTHVIVEVARDRDFAHMIDSRDISGGTSTYIPLENGNYFWRAYPAGGGSTEPLSRVYPSGTLEVIPASVITLLTPARAAEFTFEGDSIINLSWTEAEGASGYLVEISSGANMGSPEVSRRVDTTRLAQTGLAPGRWYWRVTPVFSAWVKGSSPPSETGDFSVERGLPVLAEPSLTFPAQNGNIYIESTSRRLLWRHDPAAASWLVEIADNPRLANPVISQEVKVNYYALPDDMLEVGKTWHWRVSATGGAVPAVSAARNFAVSAGTQPSVQPVVAAASPRPAPPPPPPPPEPPVPVAAVAPRVVPPPPPPAPVPVVVPPPEPPPPPLPPPEPMPDDWIQLASAGSIYGNYPPDGYSLTTGQLENANQVRFNWEGGASEYRYALYRANGEELIPPTTVQGNAYSLTNPALLSEGDYVWQVFEKDAEGNWGLPSTASHLKVTGGPAMIKTLPTQDPGALYGIR